MSRESTKIKSLLIRYRCLKYLTYILLLTHTSCILNLISYILYLTSYILFLTSYFLHLIYYILSLTPFTFVTTTENTAKKHSDLSFSYLILSNFAG